MHVTIGDLAPRDKTAKPAPLLRFDCYLDTVSFFFPVLGLARKEWSEVCGLYGDKPYRKVHARERAHVLYFQCPQPELIATLEDLASKYDGNVSRCDVASDVRPGSTDLDYIEQTRLLWRLMMLRGRPKSRGPFRVIENADGTTGTIWNPYHKGEPPPSIDIVAYPDPKSKLHGRPCGHFDIRLRDYYRRRAMKKQGIGEGASLTDLDPSILIRDHIKFVRCDIERERREYFKWLDKGQTPEHGRRMIDDAKRNGQTEYVQRLNDQYPNLHMQEDRNMVSFPHTLTWNAQRRLLSNGQVWAYGRD